LMDSLTVCSTFEFTAFRVFGKPCLSGLRRYTVERAVGTAGTGSWDHRSRRLFWGGWRWDIPCPWVWLSRRVEPRAVSRMSCFSLPWMDCWGPPLFFGTSTLDPSFDVLASTLRSVKFIRPRCCLLPLGHLGSKNLAPDCSTASRSPAFAAALTPSLTANTRSTFTTQNPSKVPKLGGLKVKSTFADSRGLSTALLGEQCM
jgi:hypothetical protein